MSDFKPVNQPIAPASADPGEEFPFLHTITVVDRVVSVDKPELVQNNIRTETVTLNLDSEWDGLSCIINIGSGDAPTSLIWSGQPVVIPAELMTNIGTLNVSVVGYGDDGALRAVTKKADAMFTVVASGYVWGDEPVPDPTTILGQLTEAADKANQAAQNAEDSTIDKVNVTMLPTGSSASGSVSDKTLSLSIPNGPQGPQGPKGDPGDLTTVAHDDTLTGSGTSVSPLGVTSGFLSSKKIEAGSDCNDMVSQGTFLIQGDCDNTPYGSRNVTMELVVYKMSSDVFQVAYVLWDGYSVVSKIYVRTYGAGTKKWRSWVSLIDSESLSDINTSLLTVETKAQALETKTTYKPITDETDLHTLFGTTGFYIKKWGTTVQNAPNSVANGIASTYLITVVSNGSDGYMRIDPMAGITDSYYLRRATGDISSWYKITATEVSE